MGLLQSNVAAENINATAIQMLRGALMDELGATNLYEELAKEIPQYKDVFEEIRQDEIHHQGRLLNLILTLDPSQEEKFKEGVNQEG